MGVKTIGALFNDNISPKATAMKGYRNLPEINPHKKEVEYIDDLTNLFSNLIHGMKLFKRDAPLERGLESRFPLDGIPPISPPASFSRGRKDWLDPPKGGSIETVG